MRADKLFFDDYRRETDSELTQLVVCCVDDTDDLSGDVSTGLVAERIADVVSKIGGKVILGITRHQLLISDQIEYTSHNSAMCFMALVGQGASLLLEEHAIKILDELKAPTSDPGLCIAELSIESKDVQIKHSIDDLIAFGKKAQKEVCTKKEAYEIAQGIDWVRLTEHGGTGDGVIGALAGVGLRLNGNDGRFRGKWNLAHLCAKSGFNKSIPVGAFQEYVAQFTHGGIQVIDMKGQAIGPDIAMILETEAKPILRGGLLTVVVELKDDKAYPCTKLNLGMIGNAKGLEDSCDKFTLDTDAEERLGSEAPHCTNCLFRRWTARGFECVK